MKHLHQGLDYRLYKIYIWGGLALIIVVYVGPEGIDIQRQSKGTNTWLSDMAILE